MSQRNAQRNRGPAPRGRVALRVALGVAGVLLVAFIIGTIRRWEQRIEYRDRPAHEGEIIKASPDGPRILIQYGDGLYERRTDVESSLIIGVDHFTDGRGQSTYEQADFLVLVVTDKKNDRVTAIELNRDTMTPVDILDDDGTYIMTLTQQLALAHTFGGDPNRCCENTVKAVSTMMRGIDIQHYVAVTMDAVGILNDQVGGVTLTVPEDMTMVNSRFVEGSTVTLHGDEALEFIRARQGVGSGLNTGRMQRQKLYISEYQKLFLQKAAADSEFSLSAVKAINDHMVSDSTAQELSRMLDTISGYDLGEMIIPPGENRTDGTFIQFYLDQAAMQELAIDLFYERVSDA